MEASYGLNAWGEGYVYSDRAFEARISPDGTVRFEDKHVNASPFTPFSWVGKTRAQQRQQQVLPERPGRDPVVYRLTPWIAPHEPRRTAHDIPQEELCPPSSSCSALPMTAAIEVNGSFDLTDEIRRGLGKEPDALDKARFLSATFEFRMKLAVTQRKRQMRKALGELPQVLDELWADARYSSRERRRLLYELWYEMDRTPEGDRAAKMIEAFILRRLPCDGADGYTPGELDAFRKTHPDRLFSPGETCGKAATGRGSR
jgi:hypothetical protein